MTFTDPIVCIGNRELPGGRYVSLRFASQSAGTGEESASRELSELQSREGEEQCRFLQRIMKAHGGGLRILGTVEHPVCELMFAPVS